MIGYKEWTKIIKAFCFYSVNTVLETRMLNSENPYKGEPALRKLFSFCDLKYEFISYEQISESVEDEKNFISQSQLDDLLRIEAVNKIMNKPNTNTNIDSNSRKKYSNINPNTNTNPSLNYIVIEIILYFKRNEIRVKAEEWVFKVKAHKSRVEDREGFLVKKLSCLLRTIQLWTKLSDVYAMVNSKSGFQYEFDCECEIIPGTEYIKKQEMLLASKEKESKETDNKEMVQKSFMSNYIGVDDENDEEEYSSSLLLDKYFDKVGSVSVSCQFKTKQQIIEEVEMEKQAKNIKNQLYLGQLNKLDIEAITRNRFLSFDSKRDIVNNILDQIYPSATPTGEEVISSSVQDELPINQANKELKEKEIVNKQKQVKTGNLSIEKGEDKQKQRHKHKEQSPEGKENSNNLDYDNALIPDTEGLIMNKKKSHSVIVPSLNIKNNQEKQVLQPNHHKLLSDSKALQIITDTSNPYFKENIGKITTDFTADMEVHKKKISQLRSIHGLLANNFLLPELLQNAWTGNKHLPNNNGSYNQSTGGNKSTEEQDTDIDDVFLGDALYEEGLLEDCFDTQSVESEEYLISNSNNNNTVIQLLRKYKELKKEFRSNNIGQKKKSVTALVESSHMLEAVNRTKIGVNLEASGLSDTDKDLLPQRLNVNKHKSNEELKSQKNDFLSAIRKGIKQKKADK